jgi:hypothetical protein
MEEYPRLFGVGGLTGAATPHVKIKVVTLHTGHKAGYLFHVPEAYHAGLLSPIPIELILRQFFLFFFYG